MASEANEKSASRKELSWQAKVAVLGVALCALAALFWPRSEGAFEAPGGFLLDAGGRPVPLGSRLAPVTLVHFWATWCPPCIVEIPALQRLFATLNEEDDLELVMVAVSDTVEKVEGFLGAGSGMVLYDPRWEVAHRYGTRKLPETYLVVRGRVVEKFEGATDWDAPEVRRRLRELITQHRGGGDRQGP